MAHRIAHSAAALELAAINSRLSGQPRDGALQPEAGTEEEPSVNRETPIDATNFAGRSDTSLRQEAEILHFILGIVVLCRFRSAYSVFGGICHDLKLEGDFRVYG